MPYSKKTEVIRLLPSFIGAGYKVIHRTGIGGEVTKSQLNLPCNKINTHLLNHNISQCKLLHFLRNGLLVYLTLPVTILDEKRNST